MRNNDAGITNFKKQALAVGIGGLSALLITVALILFSSIFVQRGVLPDNSAGILVMLLAFAGSLIGGSGAVKRGRGRTLLMGLGSALVFIVILLLGRLLIFDELEGGISGVSSSILLGGLAAGLLGGRSKTRRK